MRKLLIMAALVVSFASASQAQNTDSRGEFFAGYSLLRTDVEREDFSDFTRSNDEPFKNLNGFNVAATGYLTERFGLTGDFSAHFETENLDVFPAVVGAPTSGEVKGRSFNFLGGPQVRFSNSTRVTPFVRALAGAQHNRIETELTGGSGTFANDFETSQTDFALALGGGLDVHVSDRIAIRAFQVDYNPTFARDRTINFGGVSERIEGERTDNVRFSIGVVFK